MLALLVATFSIVAADPQTGEVGVAVASRFFSVGSVVPWARGGVGAAATQSFANTAHGPRALDLLAEGLPPEEVARRVHADDPDAQKRQFGLVSIDGKSATFTGSGCNPWAGGRSGPNYAIQGNILAGEAVVAAMEKAFLETKGDLATRLFAALQAGDAKGGDSRGRQSAALLVAREGWGYGGGSDRYIDLRVDDHPQPIRELGRLVGIGRVNGLWNVAWTAFMRKQFAEALPPMERTAEDAAKAKLPILAEVLYDLAVIRAAAGKKAEALAALQKAVAANRKLAAQAKGDSDLDSLRGEPGFAAIVGRK